MVRRRLKPEILLGFFFDMHPEQMCMGYSTSTIIDSKAHGLPGFVEVVSRVKHILGTFPFTQAIIEERDIECRPHRRTLRPACYGRYLQRSGRPFTHANLNTWLTTFAYTLYHAVRINGFPSNIRFGLLLIYSAGMFDIATTKTLMVAASCG
ncbi:hypothetical protein Trydic_g10801 [Trypoxylus dichotomus]